VTGTASTIEPWALWWCCALLVALACAATLRTGLGQSVGPPANNPFHASGQKVVAGLAPVLVATAVSAAILRGGSAACIIAAVLALAGVGAVDDWRPYTPLGKLLCQLPIFVFVTVAVPPFAPPEPLGQRVLAHVIHCIFLIVATNAMNVLDVADGLAPCVSAVSLGAVAALLDAGGGRSAALLAASFGGASVGFLAFNAAGTVVLGDSGSLALGGLLAIAVPLSVPRSAGAGATAAALVLFVPLAEVVWLSVLRLRRGLPPWRRSPHHLAYCLVRRGLSAEQAVAVLVGAHLLATMAVLWISGIRASSPWVAAALFGALVSPWLGLAFRHNARSSNGQRRRHEGGAT